MDLAAFSDENFDAKTWINNAFKSPEATVNKDAFASSLVMKLQLFIQEVNNSLEETSQQVLQSLPRVVRDAEAVSQEAALLQEQMRVVKEDIAKVERNTAQSMQHLMKIDTVKSRMQSASKALQEADNWTTLSANVEEVFQSGDINAIASKLMGMQQSLEILVDVPDYNERVQHLENLKNRLEAILSPQLVIAFNTQSTDAALMYVQIFSNIHRLPELQKYYHKCHKAQLVNQWKTIVEVDPDETILEWLTNYYDVLLSTWHSQMKWSSLVFLDVSPVTILCELFSDGLTSLEPSLQFCIEAAIKQQTNPIQFLMELKQTSERFARSLEVSIQSYGTTLLNVTSTTALAQSIFLAYKLYIQKYPSYEEAVLLEHLSNIEMHSDDLLDSVRLLGESISKVFMQLNQANERCMQFTNGCMYYGLAKTLGVVFSSYFSRFQQVLDMLKKDQSEGQKHLALSEDWTTFQHGLSIIQACGELVLHLESLDQTLVRSQLSFVKKGNYSFVSNDAAQDLSPFQSFDKILLEDADQKELKKLVTKLQQDDDPSLLPEVKKMIQKLCDTVVKTTFDLVFVQIQDHLAGVPNLKIWKQGTISAVLTPDLPTYSMSPLEYITQIGQFLMTLPQHIEPFVLQDNPALKAVLARTKLPYAHEQDLDQSEQLADYVLGCIAQGTMHIYLETVLKINELNSQAAKQLSTDIDYLCNVLDDLGLKATDPFQSLLLLLKAPSDEYSSVAEGKPPRLVSAVRSMRGLRIM